MALQTSGAISLNDIHVEAGGTSGTTCSMNDPDIRGLTAAAGRTINSTQNGNTDFADYYGASAEVSLPTSGSTVNGQVQLKEISASSYISSGGTLRIPSSMWVWSDDRTVAALTVDIPCTIINDGKIIGKGGRGGSGLRWANYPPPTTSAYNSGYSNNTVGNGSDGGPAINVTSSGVTIVNSSGAYIAGGGGGGSSSGVEPQNSFSGGGGGAGGADGGYANFNDNSWSGSNPPRLGYGGSLNAKGYNINNSGNQYTTYGGEAGGPGIQSAGEDQVSGAGYGGGLPVEFNLQELLNQENFPDFGGLAELVRGGESLGSGLYNAFNGGTTDTAGEMDITSKTIGEMEQMQADGKVFAVGAYQFTPNVLTEARVYSGLSKDDIMTPENQDRLFWGMLLSGRKRPSLAAYLTGQSDDLNAAHEDLALEFAAIQGPDGKGMYDNDKAGNYARIDANLVRESLIAARNLLMNRE